MATAPLFYEQGQYMKWLDFKYEQGQCIKWLDSKYDRRFFFFLQVQNCLTVG